MSLPRRAALAAPFLALPASGQSYPARSVRIIVPFPPGNMSDLIARVLTEEMQTRHNVQIVVDNRAGATGAIGVQAVARAEPDGHTLLLTSNSPVAVNPALTPNLPFDVLRDLMPGADPAARFEVTATGCETVACPAVVADDYNGGACGCLKVSVPSLGARVLVPVERAEPLASFPEPL
jgi:tripartite-type tricarboxylate transporter receptor subunit TctC